MNRLLICAFSLACLGQVTLLAEEPTKSMPYRQVLSAVAPAELPAKAAELVKMANPRDCVTNTVEVTKAAVTIRAAAAPSIVGAIARAVQEMAAIAAGTAVTVQPKQAAAIAKAASAAAPSEAAKIVAAICRAAPGQYRSVAIIVAKTVPGSAKDILMAVASAIPELQLGIEKALALYSGNSISVAAVLDQASGAKNNLGSVGKSPPRGPTVEPPFLPLSSTVRSLSPNTSGEVPTGGRDYSKP
jgi:hypothetical protein